SCACLHPFPIYCSSRSRPENLARAEGDVFKRQASSKYRQRSTVCILVTSLTMKQLLGQWLDLTIEEYHSGLWACFIEEGSMVSGTSIFIFQSKKLWKKSEKNRVFSLVPPAGQPPPSAEVAAKTTTAWLQPPTLHRSTTATSSRSTQQTDDATSLVDRQSSAELIKPRQKSLTPVSSSVRRAERGGRGLGEGSEREFGAARGPYDATESGLLFRQLAREKLTTMHDVEHAIYTKDDVPVNAKPCRFPQPLREELERQLTEMLKSGIIEESKSSYRSNIFLVPKAPDSKGNKKYRLVVDYRQLNEKTEPDRYPLPNILDIIDHVVIDHNSELSAKKINKYTNMKNYSDLERKANNVVMLKNEWNDELWEIITDINDYDEQAACTADASPEMRVPPKRSAGSFSGPIQTDQNNNVAEDCDDYVLVDKRRPSPAAQAAAPDARSMTRPREGPAEGVRRNTGGCGRTTGRPGATALKLGHVRIGWGELPSIPCSRGGCALLSLLEPWTRGRSLQGSRPARSSATDAARRATKQRTAKANHRAFCCRERGADDHRHATTTLELPSGPELSPRTADG
ncbi:unnamed protein product, partial [Trichogramma brassicae]